MSASTSANGTEVVFARRPFDPSPYRAVIAEGATIKQVVESVPNLDDRFWEFGVVCINGNPIDRRYWHCFKPKVSTREKELVVTMHLAPAGGLSKSKGGGGKGSGGGKSVLTIIAAIAIVAIATFISAGGLTVLAPGLFSAGAFGAGTIGAALAAAAVSTVGLMALNALTPTPSVEAETFSDRTRQDRNSFSDGNVLTPGGIIPRVIGTHKVYPPLVSTPLIDIEDDNEVIEATYALSGPHALLDIRVDNVDIDDIDDLEYQTREGWSDDTNIALFSRYGIVETPQQELSQHILDEDVKRKFKHPLAPNQDLPVWHGFTVPTDPDEIWIQLVAPQGLYHQTSDITLAVPFRVRMRPEGSSTWINLPEVHLVNKIQSALRRTIKLKFVADAGEVPSAPTPPTTYGWLEVYHDVPEQTTNNPGGAGTFGGWDADPHFETGGAFNTAAYTHKGSDNVTIYLFGSTFANEGKRWEIQMMRGVAYDPANFTESTYVYAGLGTDVHDFFLYKLSDGSISGTSAGDAVVAQSPENLISSMVVLRVSAVFNEIPVKRKSEEQASGLALIALRGRNKALNKVSVQASGYVPDWNGTEWANWVTTSNPAPHYRDILTGELNYDPMPTSVMDDDNLLEWRKFCTDFNLTVDIVAEGRSVAEIANTVAACGRAKHRFSDLLGVTIDNPRQSQSPVQIFSPRNSNGFRYDVPFAKRPDAYIIGYKDASVGYEDNQIIVYDPESSAETAGSFESITIEGIVERSKVEQRMLFDIGQLDWRPASYAIDTDIESLVCRRGDLIGLSHDVIQPRAGFARIKDVMVNAGNVESIIVDNKMQLSTGTDFFGLSNVFTEPDIFLVGAEFGAAIRLLDGTILTKQLSSTGLTDELEFAVPFPTPAALVEDCLVVVGDVGQEYGRFIVKELIPQKDLSARLLLVTEAPELHPVYEDDFGEYAIASGIASGFTNQWSATNLTYSVQAQGISGSVSGQEMKMTVTSDAHRFASYNAVGNEYAHVEVEAGLYVVAASGAATGQAGVVVRGGGTSSTQSGYVCRLLSTGGGAAGGGIELGYFVGGTFTAIATAAFSWAVNTRYRMKLSAMHTDIKAKIWAASGSEPDDWTIEVWDEEISDAGYVGLYAFEDTGDPAFDYIKVQSFEVTKTG